MSELPRTTSTITGNIKKEPRDTQKLVDDMRKDYAFKYAVYILKSQAVNTVVSIDTDSQDPRAASLRDSLLSVWERHIHKALDAIEYGRQAFEVVHCYKEEENLIKVDDMTPLPWSLSHLVISPNGYIEGCSVGKTKDDSVFVPAKSLWWCAVNAEPLKPYGESMYRGAPWEVLQDRKEIFKNKRIFIGKYALGNGVARAPESTGQTAQPVEQNGSTGHLDQSGKAVNPLQVMDDLIQQAKSGGTMIFPSTKDEAGNYLWTFDQQPIPQDGTALTNQLDQSNIAVFWSMGIPDRSVSNSGDTGSWSSTDAFQMTLGYVVGTILSQVVTSFQEHVIDPIVKVNFGDAVKLEMTWRPSGDRAQQRQENMVTAALAAPQLSPLIIEGVVDLPAAIESVGLPMGSDPQAAMDRIREKSPQYGSAPPAAPQPAVGRFSNYFEEAFERRESMLRQLSSGGGCCDD